MVSIQLDGNGLPGNNDPDSQILDDSDLLAGVPVLKLQGEVEALYSSLQYHSSSDVAGKRVQRNAFI